MPQFHDILFPIDISLQAHHVSELKTDVVTLASGHEERNSRWANARRHYTVGYGVKHLHQLAVLNQFFEARRGRFHAFRFRDKLDYKSCLATEIPSAFDQIIGNGDGVNKVFQLCKTYTTGTPQLFREITKPIAGSVRVSIDGVETNAFTVDLLTGLVTFTLAPPVAVTIQAGFMFDVPVRFNSDRLEINFKSFNAADAPHITLIEVRD